MANTAITLTNDEGALFASQWSVTVAAGDTVSFATSDGSSAYLLFSPEAAAALSPAPASPVEVSTTAVSYEFTSSSVGAYAVYLATDPSVAIPPFAVAPSNQLVLLLDLPEATFGVPNNRTRGG